MKKQNESIYKFILIVGKTRSGKDTLAKILAKDHGVVPIVSYTTRPKRDNEVNGREHWFISKEEMENIKKTSNIIAYTINEKTGYEYCATTMKLDPSKWYSYIINPEGVRYLLSNMSDNIFIHTVYCDCPEDYLAKRGSERGELESVFKKRLESERFEFDYFKTEWKSIINGTLKTDSIPLDKMIFAADKVMFRANSHYEGYINSYVSEGINVSYYKPGDKIYLINKHGKKTAEQVSIKKIIDDGKKFSEPYFVLYEYPDTCFRESDITNKLSNPFQYIKVLINKIFK